MTKAFFFGTLLIAAFFNAQGQAEIQNPTFPFWKVKGNSGTNSGSNFIGTTDNVSWRVRTNNSERMVVDSVGNVGVGTASPVQILHVYNPNGNAIVRVETPSSLYEARMEFYKWNATFTASVGFYPGNANLRLRTGNASDIVFEPNSSEVMRIMSTGNVGIGTTNALDKLHIVGHLRMVDGNQANGYIMMSDANGTGTWTDPSALGGDDWHLTGNSGTTTGTNFIGTTDNQDLMFKVNNQQAGLITDNGRNTLFGVGSGTSTGQYNSALGWHALNGSNTGDGNVAIGFNVLDVNTSGAFNVAIGYQAMAHNATASNNTAVGSGALFWNTTGYSDVALGSGALSANTSGQQNTALGNSAMNHNTTGYNNVAVGFNTMNANTTGQENAVLGSYTLTSNTTGIRNTILGTGAAELNTTASNNVMMGYYAGRSNTTGGNNTYIGFEAGQLNLSGSGNVFLGYNAGQNEIGNNLLYIDNSNTAAPLISGNFATNSVTINDSLISKYFKMSNGAANTFILQSDATGNGKWVDPATLSGGNNWSLTGNAATDTTINFVGTTDAKDLVFKTNSSEAMRILSTGQVSINYDKPPAGDIFSVYSKNNDDAVNIFASGAGRGMYISAAGDGSDAIEMLKSGATGKGIDLTMASGTKEVGIYVNSSSTARAVYIQQNSSPLPALFVSNSGTGNAIYAKNNSIFGVSPIGYFYQVSSGVTPGTYANASAVWGQSAGIRSGIFMADGISSNTTALLGTSTTTDPVDAVGVYGLSSAIDTSFGYGVVGEGNNFGVYAMGDVGATGVKPFQIDDPLDPYNKYLRHYSVESPEVINMYRGTVILDGNGEGTVTMPNYFDSVTINCTYSLTAIGKQTNVFIKHEITNGKFVVAGGAPGQKICWFVYGNRNDRYVQQNPGKTKVEVMKHPDERGKLISPELYGMPPQSGVFYKNKANPSTLKNAGEEPEKE